MPTAPLVAVQRFFGAEDLRELSRAVSRTPAYQLLELADHIAEIPDAGVRFGPLAHPPRDDTRAFVHDVLTRDWNRGTTRLDISLKHLLLYCPTLALPDPVARWAVALRFAASVGADLDDRWACELAQSIDHLRPIAPLITTGTVRMFPTFDALGADTGAMRSTVLGDKSLEGLVARDAFEVLYLEAEEVSERATDDDDVEAVRSDFLDKRRRRIREVDNWTRDLDLGVMSFEVDTLTLRQRVSLDDFGTWYDEESLHPFIVDECADILGWEMDANELDVERCGDWPHIIEAVLRKRSDLVTPLDVRPLIALGKRRFVEFLGRERRVTPDDAQAAFEFAAFCRDAFVVPVCTDPCTARALQAVSAAVVEGARPSLPVSSLPGAEYGVPPLSDVSLEDVVRLRQSEDVFEIVRTALVQLQDACAELRPVGWAAYQSTVRELAPDVVGPAHAKLQRALARRTLGARIARSATSIATRLSFGAMAGVAPPVGRAAGPAAALTSRLAERPFRRDELRIACRVLVSLTNPS